MAGTMSEAPSQDEKTQSMNVEVRAVGPSQEMIDAASARLAGNSRVQSRLKGTRSHLISFELMLPDEKGSADYVAPSRYRGTFYDYTNNLTIIAESGFLQPEKVDISVSESQPLPSAQELEEAAAILKADEKLGPAINEERISVYPAMPPLYIPAKSKGRLDRIVNIGLMGKDADEKTLERSNEVVGVNLSKQTVLRFPGGAPPTSKAAPTACGPGSG